MWYTLYCVVSAPSSDLWLKKKGPRFYDDRDRLSSATLTGKEDVASLYLTREAAEAEASTLNAANSDPDLSYEVRALKIADAE